MKYSKQAETLFFFILRFLSFVLPPTTDSQGLEWSLQRRKKERMSSKIACHFLIFKSSWLNSLCWDSNDGTTYLIYVHQLIYHFQVMTRLKNLWNDTKKLSNGSSYDTDIRPGSLNAVLRQETPTQCTVGKCHGNITAYLKKENMMTI